MPDQTVKKPLIGKGWLRIILFGVAFVIVTAMVALPALGILMGANKQSILSDPAHAFTHLMETFATPWFIVLLEAVVSAITVFTFWKLIDRKTFAALGLGIEGFTGEALTGLFMGPALLGIAALVLFLSGHLLWNDVTFDGSSLFISFGLLVLVAFSEELVFRGYILTNLLDCFPGTARDADQPSMRNKWIALGISALLFAVFHLGNPGMHTMAFVNLVLAGLLLGMNYIYTRNLWFSMLFHLSWNFFQGPLLGSRVSGMDLPSLLQMETKGDIMFTGGDFGLEGSFLTTVVLFIAVLVFAWAFDRKYSPPQQVAGRNIMA